LAYIEINGITTWYSEQGEGEPLLLLHGGVAASFYSHGSGMVDALASHFRVFCMDRRAHGFTHDPGGAITYDAMAADTIAFLEAIGCGPAHLVGYSDGANVAMLVAMRRPQLVLRLALLSGNFHYSALTDVVADPAALADQAAEACGAWYDANSPSGPGHAHDLAKRMSVEWAQAPALTEADLGGISAHTLVMGADDDMIPLEHFVAQYLAIPHSELAILPNTSHIFASEKPALTNGMLIDFLTKEPTPTLWPVRRAAH